MIAQGSLLKAKQLAKRLSGTASFGLLLAIAACARAGSCEREAEAHPSRSIEEAVPTDSAAPPTPQSLKADDVRYGCDDIYLTWDPVEDAAPNASGLAGYRVYVDGKHRYTTAAFGGNLLTAHADDLLVGIPYAITVASYDHAGNVSAPSMPLAFTPRLCAHPPGSPIALTGVATSCRSVDLSWAAPMPGSSPVFRYVIARDNKPLARENRATTYQDVEAQPNTIATYSVYAVDAGRDVSSPAKITVSTPTCSDLTAPSAPTGLSATRSDECTAFWLHWTRSTDDVGVHHYKLYRDGLFQRNAADDAKVFAGRFLAPDISYSFQVSAVDASGNESRRSDPVVVTPRCNESPARGEYSTAVVLLKFPDVANVPFSIQHADQFMFTGADSAARYIAEATYGNTRIVGDVFGWYDLPEPGSAYCRGQTPNYAYCDGRVKLAADAVARAHVDIKSYKRVIYIVHEIGLAGEAGSQLIMLGAATGANAQTVAHELGHSFGLRHAGNLDCPAIAPQTAPNLLDPGEGGCSLNRYGDGTDAMGSGNIGHFNVYNKQVLGAIASEQVAVAANGGTYVLDALELASSGTMQVRIPLELNGFFYFLQYRRPIGFDAVRSAGVQVLLHFSAENPGFDISTVLLSSLDKLDSTFVDPYRGIHVEVLEFTDANATVRVRKTRQQ